MVPSPKEVILYRPTWIGTSGWAPLKNENIKKEFIIRVIGENWWIMVVGHWVIWVFIFLIPLTMRLNWTFPGRFSMNVLHQPGLDILKIIP